MARNKYPEETVKLILDVATHLFVEKGYDATSLQDIINETNLSKGATITFRPRKKSLKRSSIV